MQTGVEFNVHQLKVPSLEFWQVIVLSSWRLLCVGPLSPPQPSLNDSHSADWEIYRMAMGNNFTPQGKNVIYKQLNPRIKDP